MWQRALFHSLHDLQTDVTVRSFFIFHEWQMISMQTRNVLPFLSTTTAATHSLCVSAGPTCILRLHLHSLLLFACRIYLVGSHFSTWMWTERRLILRCDEEGHDCTVGLGLLAELKQQLLFLHPCTTGLAATHMQRRSKSAIFSALLTHQTWTLWLFLHARATLVHILTPHLGSKCSALMQ